MRKLRRQLAAVAIAALVTSGCATVNLQQVQTDVRTNPGAAALIENVPFHKQRPRECGPAALAMLGNFWGKNVTQEEISREIYLPKLRGSLNVELALYAERFGLWTRPYEGALDDIRQKIRAGVPVLVLGRQPIPFLKFYHYWVVIGYDDVQKVLVAHSGTGENEIISYWKFERRWRGTDRWTLLLCPPEAARWDLSDDEHNDLGLYFERQDDLDRALAEYRAALELNPQNAWLYFNIGNVLLRKKDFDGAVSSFKLACELAPDNAEICNNLAYALAENGEELDLAVELAQKAIRLRPANKAAYLDTLGLAYLVRNDLALARETLNAALAATTPRQKELRSTIEQRLESLAR